MDLYETWQWIQPVLTAVGALLIGGGALTGIAYWLFKQFAAKWLDSKFAERLQSLKHIQQTELEELKLKINTLFDRKTKLHQREFESLPHAWMLLHEAHTKSAFLTGMQTWPDIDQMSQNEIEEFLETTTLHKWEKRELLATDKKTNFLIKQTTRQQLHEANKKYFEFYFYLSTNGIFVPEEITKRMFEIGKIIRGAIVAKQIQMDHGFNDKAYTDALIEFTKVEKYLKELEVQVREQFWASQKEKLI